MVGLRGHDAIGCIMAGAGFPRLKSGAQLTKPLRGSERVHAKKANRIMTGGDPYESR
jgi:hypothetical protein